jgi:hypothetical protein
MNWKTGGVLALIAFAVTLAYQVGTRLSTDAVNLAVGVLFGMLASVPVSFGLLIALTRERSNRESTESRTIEPSTLAPTSPRPTQPPVIVIAPPTGYGQGYSAQNYVQPMGAMPFQNYHESPSDEFIDARDWRIIGDDA